MEGNPTSFQEEQEGVGRVKRAVGGLKQCINLLEKKKSENKESKEKLRKKVKENQELKKMLRIKEKENQEAKEEFQTTTSMVKKYCKAEAFQTRGCVCSSRTNPTHRPLAKRPLAILIRWLDITKQALL